jgi:hypothetical protein
MWKWWKRLYKQKPHIHKDEDGFIWNVYYTREMKTLYMFSEDFSRALCYAKDCWELPEYLKTKK